MMRLTHVVDTEADHLQNLDILSYTLKSPTVAHRPSLVHALRTFTSTHRRDELHAPPMFTNRIIEGGNAITSVCLSVCLFPLCLRNRLTVDLEHLLVNDHSSQGIGGQGQDQGHGSS